MLTPVHPISRGGPTLASVETNDADPDFHRKTEPGSSGPSTAINFTSWFHVGRRTGRRGRSTWCRSEHRFRIPPSAVAGAFGRCPRGDGRIRPWRESYPLTA
jgi:hypothetical protein